MAKEKEEEVPQDDADAEEAEDQDEDIGEGDDEQEEGDEEDEDSEEEDGSTYAVTDEESSAFEKARIQILIFYQEIGKISSKKPDGPVNKFKLNLLNQTLANANALLKGEYQPFPTFQQFDEADFPSASDVVTVLAQYQRSMDKFHDDHTHREDGRRVWNIKEAE